MILFKKFKNYCWSTSSQHNRMEILQTRCLILNAHCIAMRTVMASHGCRDFSFPADKCFEKDPTFHSRTMQIFVDSDARKTDLMPPLSAPTLRLNILAPWSPVLYIVCLFLLFECVWLCRRIKRLWKIPGLFVVPQSLRLLQFSENGASPFRALISSWGDIK